MAREDPPRGADAAAIEGARDAIAAAQERGKDAENDAQGALGPIDANTDPLPRRALRTDTKGWPGREEFAARRRAEEEARGMNPVPTSEQPYRPNGSRGERKDGVCGDRGKPGALKAEEEQRRGADSALKDSLAPQLGLDLGADPLPKSPAAPGLADKFVCPPFSVLDTRAGYWQERRRAWLSLNMRAETHSLEPYRPDGSQRPPSGAYNPGHSMVPSRADDDAAERKGAPRTPSRRALNTTAGEHEAQGNVSVRRAQERREEEARQHAEAVGGRRQGLIYQHDAPASDPGFYDKKRAKEVELGRELTTEEFKRDHYSRDDQDLGQSQSVQTGTSVFDPVLCEVAYRWFSGPGHVVLDPFAGGVVRGLVAAALGRPYFGVELRPEQIADNRAQADDLIGAGRIDWGRPAPMPAWVEGDSTRLEELPIPAADLVFTCPPYADLEVYSDDPRDLSTMPYAEFRQCLLRVMEQSAARLKDDRFAVWVVGEARDKKTGHEYGFVADTVRAAKHAGLGLYNSAILLNSVGSAALRAQLILKTRKLTRVHQHVLVFVKGDAKKAAAACGSAELDV